MVIATELNVSTKESLFCSPHMYIFWGYSVISNLKMSIIKLDKFCKFNLMLFTLYLYLDK